MIKRIRKFQRRYMVVTMLTLGSTLSFAMIHSATITASELLACCFHCEYDYNKTTVCPAAKRLAAKQIELEEHRFLECTVNEKVLLAGYIVSHIPGGAISDIYGGKHLVSLSILMTSVVVSLLPVIMRHYRLWLMIMTNLLLGLLMGVSKSAGVSLLAHWLPNHQRAFLGCIYFSGEILGAFLGAHVSNSRHNSTRWELFFYSWPALGLLYYVLFVIVVYASARTDPYLSDAEQGLLRKGMRFPSHIPWRRILKDEAVWGLFAAQVGHAFVTQLVHEGLPDYLKYYVGANVKRVELISIPPLGLIGLMIAGGYLADQKTRKKFIPVGYLRCFYIVFGNLLPFAFAMTLPIFGCSYYATAAVYSLSVMASGPIYAGAHTNTFDLTYHYAGTIYGLTNGLAGPFNFVALVMFKYINKEQFYIAWKCMALMDFMIGASTVLLYFILMHGEGASWDYID